MSKSSKNSFLMQGMILAAASIVCRVIGLLYRSPLFGIIGEEGIIIIRTHIISTILFC